MTLKEVLDLISKGNGTKIETEDLAKVLDEHDVDYDTDADHEELINLILELDVEEDTADVAAPPPVKTVAQKMKEEADGIDWDEAEQHLKQVESNYLEIMGLPGVNVQFFFAITLPPIRGAWNKGVRTQSLYDDIMGLK